MCIMVAKKPYKTTQNYERFSQGIFLHSMVLIPLWSCIPTRSHYCSISVLFIEAETVCFRFVCPSGQSFLCRHTHVLMFTCRQPMVTSTITSPLCINIARCHTFSRFSDIYHVLQSCPPLRPTYIANCSTVD